MEWLALSLFVCTVLLLIDRNQAWPNFWRFGKVAAGAVLALTLTLGFIYLMHDRQASAAPPVTITPDQK